MREIIGERMIPVFEGLNIPYKSTYQGYIGYWPNFEVYEISDEDYEKLSNISDEVWDSIANDFSWWRGAKGSNMGIPNEIFTINGKEIIAWDNVAKIIDLECNWYKMTDEEHEEWDNDLYEYLEAYCPIYYNDLLEYFCEVLGASTERNVCALATDLAKYNNMTIGELFSIYGGSK